MVLAYGIGVLFKCTTIFLYFLNRVKREKRDFVAEKEKPVLDDHSISDSIAVLVG